jgi:hypothetical protein
MTTVILSAASELYPSLQTLQQLLHSELVSSGEEDIRIFELCTTQLAYCQGEFDCWIKTPGVCRAKDAEQEIVQAIHDADQIIYLDKVTFGGHSYEVKRAQDRLICLLMPFFEKRLALTHHRGRYEDPARLYALGWMPTAKPNQVQTWIELADANAVNMLAPHVGAAVVDDSQQATWSETIRTLLSSVELPGSEISTRALLRDALVAVSQPENQPIPSLPITNVALLIGSAKPKGTSASETLARFFANSLQQDGITTEFHFATEFVRTDQRSQKAASAIAHADLFVVFTPLYVDSLPALATHALEMVFQARLQASKPALFAALINCGFPEPEQTRTAMRIVRHFSKAANYHWAGGLPLGAGGTIQPDGKLEEQHGPAEHAKRSLGQAAKALALGETIPQEALELMMKSPLPDALYRLIGDLGWRYQAHKKGVAQRELKARPLNVIR